MADERGIPGKGFAMTAFDKLKLSHLLAIKTGIIFTILLVLILLLVNDGMRTQARLEAEAKARILLDRNMAVHTYFSHDLKPRLFEWTEPFRGPDYFDPVWMSSTYAVRKIHNYFSTLNPNGYWIKDAAIDARSPENEADPQERAFIERLNRDRALEFHAEIRRIDGKPFLTVLRKGETMEESCLRCHSEPEKAPRGLFQHYDPDRSFHRKANEVVSAISMRIPLSSAYEGMNRTFRQLALLLAGLLLVIFGIQLYLYRRFLVTPLAVLRDKTIEIAFGKKQHLGDPVPEPAIREFRDLAQSFNAMSSQLRLHWDHLEDQVAKRTDELKKANECLVEEVREREKAEATVRKLNEALEERVRQRTSELETAVRELESISYSISHDLRSPLRSIDGFSHLLLEDYQDRPLDDEGKRSLGRIRKAAQRMGDLHDDIVKLLSVIRADLHRGPVDLSRMAQEILEQLRQRDPNREVVLSVHEGIVAHCDPSLIRIAMTHLLENAWKFTRGSSKAHIAFGTEMEAGKAVHFIRDNGIGFDMAYSHKLFGTFQRLHGTDDYEGTGIGLATVQRIIRRHGGQIWAEAAPNQGATFFFTLPGESAQVRP